MNESDRELCLVGDLQPGSVAEGQLQRADPVASELLIGRASELEVVTRAIEAATAGAGSLSLVSGPPGIGKTRLAHEISKRANRLGLKVFWGRCWESEGTPVFWPWAQVVRNFARESQLETCERVLGAAARDIAKVVPGLSDLVPHLVGTAAEVEDQTPAARFQLFDGFLAFFHRMAGDQATLLVFDDLHFADQGSLLLLEFIANNISESRLALLITYRDGLVHSQSVLARVLSSITRHSWTRQTALPGLNELEVADLLDSLTGVRPSQDLTAAIWERTDGNPFFLRELAALLPGNTGAVAESIGQLQFLLPQTVRQMVTSYLRIVSQDCLRILSIASVLGRDFEPTLLGRVAELPMANVEALLLEAVERRVLVRFGIGQYRFAHASVREIVYESLSSIERASLHERSAKLLEQTSDSGLEARASTVAHHYYMALPFGDSGNAVRAALIAGREAQKRLAHEQAIVHFGRGLELWPAEADDGIRCELLLGLGEAQASAGLWADSKKTFGRAARAARHLGRAEEFARAAIGFKGRMGATAPIDLEAATLLREAARSLTSVRGELLVKVLSALSRCLYFGNAPQEISEHSQKAFEIALETNDRQLYLLALEAQLMGIWNPENLDRLLGDATNMLNAALECRNMDMVFSARMYRHYALLSKGCFADSFSELKHAETVACESGNVAYGWHAPMIRAARALAKGRFKESEALSDRARVLGERVHDSSPIHNYMLQRFQRARLSGNFDGLEFASSAAEDSFPDIVAYRAGLALLLARQGRTERARNILSAMSQKGFGDLPVDSLMLWTLSILAEATVICGEDRWRKALYRRLRKFREISIVASWGSAFDGAVSHYLGLLAGSLCRWELAFGHFEAALVMNGSFDCEPLVARTKYYYAEALARCGVSEEMDRALGMLQQCIESFDRLEMVGFLELSQTLLKSVVSRRGAAGGFGVRPESERVQGEEEDVAARQQCVFRSETGFWTIVFGGRVLRIRHCRGLGLIAELMRRPETDIHVLDLVGAAEPPEARVAMRPDGGHAARLGDAGPLLDEQAREEYRQRSDDCRAELAEAEERNDLGRAERLRGELAFLEKELGRAYGRTGRVRVAAAAVERARVRVRNNITAALTMIRRAEGGELMWRHLVGAIRTGTVCSYRPERPVSWVF